MLDEPLSEEQMRRLDAGEDGVPITEAQFQWLYGRPSSLGPIGFTEKFQAAAKVAWGLKKYAKGVMYGYPTLVIWLFTWRGGTFEFVVSAFLLVIVLAPVWICLVLIADLLGLPVDWGDLGVVTWGQWKT